MCTLRSASITGIYVGRENMHIEKNDFAKHMQAHDLHVVDREETFVLL